VPYRFCSDEYVFGTPTCYAFDMGVDAWEIVSDAVERYWSYYWFNNFKRDRVFFDEWDYMDGLYWRYFAFVQNTYQHWVFDQWFTADTWEWLRQDPERWGIEDAPWAEAGDAGLSGSAAAMRGLRFLQEVLAIPEPGAYLYDDYEGYYWSFEPGALPLCPEGTLAIEADEWCADANVSLGPGRYFLTVYDVDSGYYFYERIKWIGTFYDKLLALETLTSPDTYFLGVDTSQSVDQWAISMYLSFPDEIQRTFAGIAADRFDLFAGVFDDGGGYVPPDPFAKGKAAETLASQPPVDPQTSFTLQLYALWYGMAWLNANFDNTFNDTAKIWLAGSGEALTPAEGAEVVTFSDPWNGRVYQALKPEGAEIPGVGWTMLERAQGYKDEWALYAEDPETDPGTLDYLKWRVTNAVENIEVVRGLYDLYGYLYF
jgi:hypothetical protein